MSKDGLFLEVDFAQEMKSGENICGDCFLSRKTTGSQRTISVLSDGLGSGVKANILSSMTATMAQRFISSNMEIIHSAEVMMDALPVCQVRKISYATFTIVDCVPDGRTRIIEMDNPPFLLIRKGEIVPVKGNVTTSGKWKDRSITVSEFNTLPEDRIIIMSDGITQSGMGKWATPLGWRLEGAMEFALHRVRKDPGISARELSRAIMREALAKEEHSEPGDDMTCAVLYFRNPRRLTLLTGPPFKKEDDREYARILEEGDGWKIICGGTTAKIIGRELGRTIKTDLDTARSGLPPLSSMDGVDLITEGILTLTKTLGVLEGKESARSSGPASRLVNMFLESDMIDFVVGSRINEAHQDPTLPQEIEIRRNIVKNISAILEKKYLKTVTIRYI